MISSDFYRIIIIISFFTASILLILLLRLIHQLRLKISDLTKENEKISEETSKKQKNPLGKLFSATTKTMTLGIKKDGKINEISDNLLALLGYTKKQLIGKNIYGTLIAPISKHEPLEMNLINKIFQNPRLYTEYETALQTKSGEKVWISWTQRLLTDKKGNPTELKSVGFDITERKKLEEQLQFMAYKDPLTGVLNRLSLLENGTRELKRTIRYKHDFSVLALRLLSVQKDLSSLQVENLLKQVVLLCRETVRDTDYMGRIGEAEFILLLPETEKENVPFLQKRLLEKIKDYNHQNKKLPIEVSFGVASYTAKTKSIDELISKAISNIQKRKIK